MRRLVGLVGLGGLALAAACASLVGLSGGDGEGLLDAGDGGDERLAEAAATPDPCRHATYPPPPATDDDPAGQIPPVVVALREESVAGSIDGGAPIGFDLDGVCSCFPDPTTAHQGLPSCEPPDGGAASCDSDGGADLRANALLAAYTVPSFSGASRGPTLVVKITKYNGRANDREVFVGFIVSPGIFDRDAGCAEDDAGPPYRPTWKGCDVFALDSRSVLPGTSEPMIYLPAYVTDHILVVPPSVKPVTFVINGSILPISGSLLTARLTAVDAQQHAIDPPPDVGQAFHLEGLTGGRLATPDALRAIVSVQAQAEGGPLCGPDTFFATVKRTFVCPAADIVADPQHDFTNARCDALSLAAAFTAEPALLGTVRLPPPSACADPDDPKFAALYDCAQ